MEAVNPGLTVYSVAKTALLCEQASDVAFSDYILSLWASIAVFGQ